MLTVLFTVCSLTVPGKCWDEVQFDPYYDDQAGSRIAVMMGGCVSGVDVQPMMAKYDAGHVASKTTGRWACRLGGGKPKKEA